MNLSKRQKKIIKIVKDNQPITSKEIANKLDLTRGALRSDLSVLTMANILEAKPRVGYFYSQDNSYLKDFSELYDKKVKEIKGVPVVIKEEATVYDAIVKLFLEDVGSLFVIDERENLIGVVSRKDLLKITLGDTDINQVPISVVMTRMPNLITIKDSNTIFEAAKKIVEYEIDSIPVIEEIEANENLEENTIRVIGKVSKTNIARVFVDFKLSL